jgi:cysteine desulfurase/selenocysteine lyase
MTTSERPPANQGIPDLGLPAASAVPSGLPIGVAAPPPILDDATLDQIVSNVLLGTPGLASPEAAIAGATRADRSLPSTASAAPSPTASVGGLPGELLLGAPLLGSPLAGAASHYIPSPTAASASAAQTALTSKPGEANSEPETLAPNGIGDAALERIAGNLFGTTFGGRSIPGAVPPAAPGAVPRVVNAPAEPPSPVNANLREIPLNLDGLDGSLPRLFDDAGRLSRGTSPSPTSSYYFLTPALGDSTARPVPYFNRRVFDVADIRRDFPILQERIHGKQLVWLDNAATTQKPHAVIERLKYYYEHEYSNVHRGAHTLAARSTEAYENAREKLQRFLGAASPEEIVFVRGTTEGVNLVAASFGSKFVTKGDEIVLSTLEHHSNIVPWQFLAQQTGAVIKVVPVTDRGEVLLGDVERTLSGRTRIVAVTHVSNALGTVLPVREITQMAHRRGARVLIDGAQAVSHFPVNVQELDADFYVLSGHKMFGPSAIGVVYGKKALLDEMPPWQGGGNMIQRVTFEHSTFADPPGRFEAGTAALGPAVGLGAAADYLTQIGMENVAAHERQLLAYTHEALSRIPGVRLIGTAPEKTGVASFITDDIPPEEMGKILDQEGIAVRAGHHCAQPTMDRFGLEATVRPSLALYNTHDEIDQLARAVRRALRR